MKVLIADDHQLFLDGLSSLLRTQSYVSELVCINTLAGVQESLDASTDLVIIDLRMPGVQGISHISDLISSNPTTPFIVMSATENQADINTVLRAGAVSFIPKAAKSDAILKTIKQVIDGDVIEQTFTQLSDIDVNSSATNLPKFIDISERQLQVLQALGVGSSNQKIAEDLNISEHTVKSHLAKLFKEFDVNSRLACVQKARSLNML